MRTHKTYASEFDVLSYNDEYCISRWQQYYQSVIGCYLIVVFNQELYKMQKNHDPHVVCVVDDFGNLVRKP